MDTSTVLGQLICTLLTILLGSLIGLVIQKIGAGRLQSIKEILAAKSDLVTAGVAFVEQAYKEMHGADKFQKAAAWIEAEALKIGIKFTDTELQGLIEAAVNTMNKAIK